MTFVVVRQSVLLPTCVFVLGMLCAGTCMHHLHVTAACSFLPSTDNNLCTLAGVMQNDDLCTVSSRAAGVRFEASDQHCNMCWLHLHILVSRIDL